MNAEQLRQTAAAFNAAADEKSWEWEDEHGRWLRPYGTPIEHFIARGCLVRPAPGPQMRDWNCPEDVPLNCWLRAKGDTARSMQVIAFDKKGPVLWHWNYDDEVICYNWSSLDVFEYSTTRRKDDWHPCKVLVP